MITLPAVERTESSYPIRLSCLEKPKLLVGRPPAGDGENQSILELGCGAGNHAPGVSLPVAVTLK